MAKLCDFGIDIYCLQELDGFKEHYIHDLRRLGLDGFVYKQRTSETREKHDGSGIIFSKKTFDIIAEDHIEFNDLNDDPRLDALRKAREQDRPAGDDLGTAYFIRDCVAALCVLDHMPTGTRILVASVHLFWDPNCTDVKVLQAMMLLRKLNRLAAQYSPHLLIVGGDFNSMPDSAAVELLTTGWLRKEHTDCWNVPDDIIEYINETVAKCSQIGCLQSAYSIPKGENETSHRSITTITDKFQGFLDYIFYLPRAQSIDKPLLQPRVLSLPSVQDCIRGGIKALPAEGHPSDHLPVVASFSLPIRSAEEENTTTAESGWFSENCAL